MVKKYHFLLIIGTIALLFGLVGVALAKKPTMTTVRLDGTHLLVQHAKTPAEQERGLMGWCALRPNQGMLFDFAQTTTPTFWMKGMRIPIDIIWIHEGIVIGWESNVLPDKGQRLYPAPGPVTRVLELPANWAAQHELRLGDTFEE